MIEALEDILPVKIDGVPEDLRSEKRWLNWKATQKTRKDGKTYFDKQPRDAKSPWMNAKTNDRSTWASFAEAVRSLDSEEVTGLGFALCEGFVGIDLDNVRDKDAGTLHPAALAILKKLHTYSEVSPSGTGVKAFLRGSVSNGRKGKADGIDVEVYGSPTLAGAKYFTVTGHQLPGTPSEVAEATGERLEEIERLCKQMDSSRQISGRQSPPQRPRGESLGFVGDAEVIDAGRRIHGEKFSALFDGDSSSHGDDPSAADLAFANHLAWLCGPGREDQVKRIMLGSGRQREKFQTNKTYLDRTIANAYSCQRGFYEWRDNGAGSSTALTVPAIAANKEKTGAVDVLDLKTWTEIGLSRRLIAEAEGAIVYAVDRGLWMRWNDIQWEDDREALHAQRIAKAIPGKLWNEIAAAEQFLASKQALAAAAFVLKASSRRFIESAIALTKSEPEIAAKATEFDTQPFLLNCLNGTVDLLAKGGPTLQPHRREDRLTQAAGVEFDPSFKCPLWQQFVSQVTQGDAELASFLQRSFGVALTSDQSEQRLWVHHGEGGNGKGTFLSVVAKVMGSYAGPVSADIFVSRRNDQERDLKTAQLIGKRLAFAQESDDGARLSESSVKAMTGSDVCTARRLYQNPFQVNPTWHIHLAVNHRPAIKGRDAGIWRRVLLIPWLATFVGEAKRDRAQIEAELFAEGPGILNWMIRGFEAWREDGLRPPVAVTAATDDYRDASDSVGAWMADACFVSQEAIAGATDLFEDYRTWCSRAGFEPLTQTSFGRSLDELGHSKDRPTGGPLRGKTVRKGLGLLGNSWPKQ